MRNVTRAILSGALSAAMVTAFAPSVAFASVAWEGESSSQFSYLNSADEDDDSEFDETSVKNCTFEKMYYFGSVPKSPTFTYGRNSDFETIYKGEDFSLGTRWYKCVGEEGSYEYVSMSSRKPSEPGVYALKVTGIGIYHDTTWAYLTIVDPYDFVNVDYRFADDENYGGLVVGEDEYTPKFSVTFTNIKTGKDTTLKEGVDYKRLGWYRVTSKDEEADSETLEFVGDHITEAGEYKYRLEGIGSYHGTLDTRSLQWSSPYDFTLYDFDKRYLQLGRDDLNNPKLTMSRKTSQGKKITLKQGRDFEITGWCGTRITKNEWQFVSDKLIKTPTKVGPYLINVEGIGNFAGQKTSVQVTVYAPKMTWSYPVLNDGLMFKNTALESLTLDNKVKRISAEALSGCKNLKKLVIGKNVSGIAPYAFNGCKKLKTVTVKSSKLTKKSVTDRTFTGSSVTTIKVDTGNKKTDKKTVAAYKKLFTKEKCGKNLKVK